MKCANIKPERNQIFNSGRGNVIKNFSGGKNE